MLAAIGWVWILATATPFLRRPNWWIRAFEFPRAQVTFFAVLTAVGLTIWGDLSNPWTLVTLVTLIAAIVYQSARMIVYTAPYPKQVLDARPIAGPGRIRLITCNVLIENHQSERVLGCVRKHDPDVFLAVECDDWWDERLEVLAEDYPYSVRRPQDNTYGMVLYSRFPLEDVEVRFLRRQEIPSIRTVVTLADGVDVVLYGVHPEPPYPEWATDTAQRDAELLTIAREAADEKRPVIVMGDLNDVAWSRTTRLFQNISGLLDPRIGRSPMTTFPADWPLCRYPLDHVFISSHFKLVDLERLEKVGSDHFPLLIEVQHENGAALEHEEPEADALDEDEAEEIEVEADQRLEEEANEGARSPLSASPDPARRLPASG